MKKTITITNITEEDKTGDYGPYVWVRFRTSGSNTVSGKKDGWNSNMKIGDKVELEIEEKTHKNGNKWYKMLGGRIIEAVKGRGEEEILHKLDLILDKLKTISELPQPSQEDGSSEPDQEEWQPEEDQKLPF